MTRLPEASFDVPEMPPEPPEPPPAEWEQCAEPDFEPVESTQLATGSTTSTGSTGSNTTPSRTGCEPVLDDVRAWLDRFIVTTSPDDLDILALWAVHTHVADQTYTTPRLLIDSAVPGSGKTTVLEHLSRLCLDPIQAASLSSPALLARILANGTRTILIDEADRSLNEKNPLTADLLAILNSGYKKGGTRPVLTPGQGGTWDVTEMTTFSPVAMAGNAPNLPDDTKSRCIRVLLLPDIDGTAEESDWEAIEEEAEELAGRIKQWCDSVRDQIRVRPELPTSVKARARERWSPLKRVADATGGRWPNRVDELAMKEVQLEADLRNEGLMIERPHISLLKHVYAEFDNRAHVPTTELVASLVARHPEIWGNESPYGRALTEQRLGRMMHSHFKVKSWRANQDSPRGYRFIDLETAFRSFGLIKPVEPVEPAEPVGQVAK